MEIVEYMPNSQVINNDRTVPLLTICGKIFERLIFNSFFECFQEHNLLSAHQSGFPTNDSCVNQLLSIVHDIYTAFHAWPTLESCGVFLDISKAFDEVGYEGLIFKIKSLVISYALLEPIESFLRNKFQRVVLNSQTLEWLPVKAVIPQRSILDHLCFLIYINDLSNDIVSTVKLFADDTSLFSIVHNAKMSAYELNKDLENISECPHQWKMSFNPEPNKQVQEVIFSRKAAKSSHPQICLNNVSVSCVSFQKHLGVNLDKKFNFSHHI